jgi:hypothetical protein
MQVVLLKKDGRCLWLERKVLKSLLPTAIKAATNPFAKRLYLVVDWISSDRGRVGVDLRWFRPFRGQLPRSADDGRVPSGQHGL